MLSKLYVLVRGQNATIPTRGSEGAAGYDLYSAQDVIIPASTRFLISTELSILVPKGTYGRIAPRSGLSLKGIDVGAGVIDSDYTGEVKILLINNGINDFNVKKKDRVAQLILEKIEVLEIEAIKSIETTERGESGFGSTGI
jgi:dUTP pyrophosphatase